MVLGETYGYFTIKEEQINANSIYCTELLLSLHQQRIIRLSPKPLVANMGRSSSEIIYYLNNTKYDRFDLRRIYRKSWQTYLFGNGIDLLYGLNSAWSTSKPPPTPSMTPKLNYSSSPAGSAQTVEEGRRLNHGADDDERQQFGEGCLPWEETPPRRTLEDVLHGRP